MPSFYGAVSLQGNYIDMVKGEVRNAVVQNLGSAPASPSKGQLYMDTGTNNLYFYDGTAWVSTRSAGSLTPASTVTTQAVADAPVVGVSTNYAREDHKHGREAFAAPTAETTFGAASAAGSAATLPRSDHQHGNPTHVNADHAAIALSALGVPTAAVNFNNQNINNVADPTTAQQAATKNYVDNSIAGLSWKAAARVASTANLALTGLVAVDGVTVAANDRVLAKNQTTASQNGLYVAASGAWTRTTDADTAAELLQMAVYIQEGTTLADTAWVCTTNAPITIGSTNLTFAQFSGGGTYTAGSGLNLAGNVFSAVAGTGITVGASISIDTTITARRYAAALTGTASPETVTHNLNTTDVLVAVRNSSNQFVEVDWTANGVNTIQLTYNPNLGAGCRVAVLG